VSIYKRRYLAYEGATTGAGTRFGVLMRYALHDAWSSRVTIILGVLCLVPALFMMVFLYIMNNDAVRVMIESGPPVPINEKFFLIVLHLQSWPALVLTAWVGPRLISADMANSAIPLLLSRPISRFEYVLAKMAVLAGLLSAVTWVPTLLLFAFQAHLAGTTWAGQHAHLPAGLLAGSVLWIVVLCFLALALAAWVRWRMVATGLVFAAVFIPAGMAGVFNVVMRTQWGSLISLPEMMNELWRRLLHAPPSLVMRDPLPAWTMLLALALLCAGAAAALHARVRAREVVRG
jgi:ABC-type transport system involved in multi-copper enzyme maturation permease subunit